CRTGLRARARHRRTDVQRGVTPSTDQPRHRGVKTPRSISRKAGAVQSYECQRAVMGVSHAMLHHGSRRRAAAWGERRLAAVAAALPGSIEPALPGPNVGPNLDRGFNPLAAIIFFGIIGAAGLFVAYSIYQDVGETGTKVTSFAPFILLFVALLIALGFEFV